MVIATLIIQAVGLFGLLGSILLLARQLRQLERSIRGTSYQSIIYDSQINKIFVDEPDLADMWDGIDYLEVPDQQNRMRRKAVKQRWLVSMCLDHYENIFIQHELGNIPPQLWARWSRHLANVLGRQSVFRATWPSFKPVYYDKFADFVDHIMNSAPPAPDESKTVVEAITEIQQNIGEAGAD